MQRTRRLLARLWTAERGIASVEYAMLLAMIAGGIMFGLELLSGAVSDQMTDTALWFGGDGDAGAENCGNEGGAGQGSGNTC